MSNPQGRFARLRHRVDEGFARWAGLVARRPGWVLLACLVVAGAVVPQARHVEVSTDTEEFLLPDHPIRQSYRAFREQFGSDNYVLVTLAHDDIFSQDFLRWLDGLHDALEEDVPYVNEITSLVNVRSTRGEGDELIVDDLLEDWPENESDLARIEALVRATPFHRRLVLGDDGRHTTIQLELENYVIEESEDLDFVGFEDEGTTTPGERERLRGIHEEEIFDAVNAVLEAWSRPDVETYVAGTPVTNVRIFQDMGRNMALFVVLSVVFVSIVLALLFRRLAGVFLPLVVVFATLSTTMGLVGWRGTPVNMTVQMLPSFLLAIGVSACIHVLVLFFQSYDRGASKEQALRDALSHAGMPIVMACATTAAGFLSFLATDIAPVRDMGFMAPAGIAAALFYCLCAVPALLCVAPLRRRPVSSSDHRGPFVRAVVAIGDLGHRRPVAVLAGTALVVGTALAGVPRVVFEQNALGWFPDEDPIHVNTEITDSVMGGSASIELLIDTGRENGLHDPDLQRRLADFETYLTETGPDRDALRKTVSVSGVLREIHQALNENDPTFYRAPDDRTLIAQELLLFENSGSDDLEKIVDSQFQIARLSVRAIWGSGPFFTALLDRVESSAREALPGPEIVATGVVPIIMTSMLENEVGMTRSYALALLTITPLMMLMIGSLRGGLSSMVPNLAPIILVVGGMGWAGVPFDVFTVMTGGVAIGLAVDDTIHFMHVFYREFEGTGDARSAIRHTLETTGEALLTTSLVLAIGFSVFLVATMPPLRTFGVITTGAILLAFLADIVVAPALVTLATRHRVRRSTSEPGH